MGFFSSAASKLKSTFLPSPQVSRARRLKTFGTESKAVAGTAIIGSAAAAIALGPTGIARGITQTAKFMVSSPTRAVASIGSAGFVAGGGLKLAPKLFDVSKKAAEVTVPILLGETKATAKDASSIGRTAGAVVGAAGIGAVVGTVIGGAVSYLKDKEPKTPKVPPVPVVPVVPVAPVVPPVLPKGSPDSPLKANSDVSDAPITPATQILGKPAGTSVTKRRKRTATKKPSSQSMRVNIYNQSKHLSIRRSIAY